MKMCSRCRWIVPITSVLMGISMAAAEDIGREVAVPKRLRVGDEFRITIDHLIEYGQKVFSAPWTVQEGAGRPLTNGIGGPIVDTSQPLLFPRSANRLSAPDANSCAGCHNAPFGAPGGGGDLVTNVFVQGQRFDFATFDPTDTVPRRGSVDERGMPITLNSIANSRSTLSMYGSGFVEMLARQMTAELQAQRDALTPGSTTSLSTKGISFGKLGRRADGSWDTTQVEGLPASSLVTDSSANPPSLVIRPFHQSGSVVSLRQFTVNAFNHHHGMQASERFGLDTDPDGDGFINELTVTDITAATIFQATLPVPGRVIPNDPQVERAIRIGETRFRQIGCASCHVPALPLQAKGWVYVEPNPYNPPGTLAGGTQLKIDLTDRKLPGPRLRPDANGIVWVPAFTDLKLHDICDGPNDPNIEPLDMNQPAGSPAFFSGNRKFITRKLWGVANEPPYYHHGMYTTLREAIEAHRGEARDSYLRWKQLSESDRDAIIEFLKSLQVLPPGARHMVVDENGRGRHWESPLY